MSETIEQIFPRSPHMKHFIFISIRFVRLAISQFTTIIFYFCFLRLAHMLHRLTERLENSIIGEFTENSVYSFQGCSPRGICLGSRGPRGSFLAGSASPRPQTVLSLSCLGIDLTASASALPHSFCLGLGSVWKVAPCLGSVVSVNLRERPPTEIKFKFNVTHRDFGYF